MKLVADLHTHTLASAHAYSTVTENTLQAEKAGLKMLAVTDHGPQMEDSPHLWHHHNYKALPRIINNVFVLRGIEADIIDNNGRLDIDGDTCSKLDWIIASYHWGSGSEREFTNSYVKALENPDICCLGHTDSIGFPYDIREVCSACHSFGKAMELNVARIRDTGNTHAYEFYRRMLEICAEEEAFIVVNTDSHFWSTIGSFEPAEKLLDEIGFPEELILNADEGRIKQLVSRRCGKNIFE